ncbi:MAG: hypothetical protein HY262_09980 [Chloroflexi bacterium]|nr:hypothetical protein [Chloroflexota bacterium]
MDLDVLLAVSAMVLAVAIPVVAIVPVLRVSRDKLLGRRHGRDRFLGAVSRAGVQASHLQADTPDVDDIAVPLPPGPHHRRR